MNVYTVNTTANFSNGLTHWDDAACFVTENESGAVALQYVIFGGTVYGREHAAKMFGENAVAAFEYSLEEYDGDYPYAPDFSLAVAAFDLTDLKAGTPATRDDLVAFAVKLAASNYKHERENAAAIIKMADREFPSVGVV